MRNRTTGVLYVLDELFIGLHPANIEGLTGVIDDLAADGNSIVLVDHDIQLLSHADWFIELEPEAEDARQGRQRSCALFLRRTLLILRCVDYEPIHK